MASSYTAHAVTTITATYSSASAQLLGPLTTTFSPPASCVDTISVLTYGGTVSGFGRGDWWHGDMACYPTGTATTVTAFDGDGSWYRQYFSPATICPAGWNTAASIQGDWYGLTLGDATTGFMCCPGPMTWAVNAQACLNHFSSGSILTYLNSTAFETTTFTNNDHYALAYAVAIVNEASATTTSDSSTVAATTASGPTATSSSPSSSSGSSSSSSSSGSGSSSSSSSSSLSKGAIAGIAIGAAAAIVLLGLFLLFLFRRRQRQRGAHTKHSPGSWTEGAEHTTAAHSPHVQEMEHKPVGELSAIQDDQPHELPGDEPSIPKYR